MAYRFDQELLSRYAVLQAAPKNQVVTIEPLTNYPSSIFFADDDITYNENERVNQLYAEYFQLQKIKMKIPNGRSPFPSILKEVTY